MNEVFANSSDEDKIYPLTTAEIAAAQQADASLKHLFKRYAVIDQGFCWVRYTYCSDYKARGASGNYKARGASGDYKARGASGNYEARGASDGKYEARMVIFRILAAVNRFSWISRKEESR